MHGAAKATLGRQGQLFKRHVFGSLFNAVYKVVLAFQCAKLGGHQAEYHRFAFRQITQGFEVPAAGVVIFHKVGIKLHFLEQSFRHRLIVARCRVGAFEIAPAQVHGQRHAGWLLRHHQIDELRIAVWQLIGIVAPLASSFAHFFIAQVG